MSKTYTHQAMQENLLSKGATAAGIRDAVNSARQNLTRSAVVQTLFGQYLIKYIRHDCFEIK